MAQQIQVRRDSAADWTAAAPTLADGEIGFETDTGKFKIGNGTDAWADLDYFEVGAGTVDTSGTPVANDFARFTDADTIEGRSYAEVRADLSLEPGTDVQAVLAEGAFVDGDKTKLDGIEAAADVTDATNVDAAGAVMNSDTSTAAMSFVVDEDDMSSDSATKVPTQQSVKAYVDSASGTSGALASVVHNPGTVETYSTTSTTSADLDATDLILPDFTVPASGAIEVTLSAWCESAGTGTNETMQWSIRDASGVITGSSVSAWKQVNTNSSERVTVTIILTGLSGTKTGWRWGWRSLGGGTVKVVAGGTSGQASMIVKPL